MYLPRDESEINPVFEVFFIFCHCSYFRLNSEGSFAVQDGSLKYLVLHTSDIGREDKIGELGCILSKMLEGSFSERFLPHTSIFLKQRK